LYSETRARIRESLEQLSASWPAGALGDGGEKRIVFYGAGEVAEIGYVSLQETDLHLAGVVDDQRQGQFFGLPIHTPDELQPHGLGGAPYGRVVVMSFRDVDQIRAKLRARGFPSEGLFLL
jgi:hypothetical protein